MTLSAEQPNCLSRNHVTSYLSSFKTFSSFSLKSPGLVYQSSVSCLSLHFTFSSSGAGPLQVRQALACFRVLCAGCFLWLKYCSSCSPLNWLLPGNCAWVKTFFLLGCIPLTLVASCYIQSDFKSVSCWSLLIYVHALSPPGSLSSLFSSVL